MEKDDHISHTDALKITLDSFYPKSFYGEGILNDIEKMKTSDNEILVKNVVGRVEGEFLRLSGDIKKNHRLNVVSIAIGIIGIVVSIMMAMLL